MLTALNLSFVIIIIIIIVIKLISRHHLDVQCGLVISIIYKGAYIAT